MKYDYLIVALGNIGSEYEKTRHNIGFMVGAELCKHFKVDIKPSKLNYYQADINYRKFKIAVIFPTTYMNLSGRAVKNFMERNEIEMENIIAIIDEYNFPLGKLHFKKGGSDGGHNGMNSLIYELENSEFYRLRFGIDRKFEQGGLVDYVLSNFEESELPSLKESIANSIIALKHIFDLGANKAMSAINSGRLFKPQIDKKEKAPVVATDADSKTN